MLGTVLWVGLVVTVAAFVIDAIMWSFVFNKGMEHLTAISQTEAKATFATLMAKQFANTLLFGLTFTYLYSVVRGVLPASGLSGGLEFAVLLWLPTVAHHAIANGIWYGKSRALAGATAWSALVKFLVCGAAVALLLK